MGVNQIIFFNLDIFLNIVFGFIIFLIAVFFTLILIRNNFVRLVLVYGYSCYLFPIFVIKEWQIDYHNTFKYFEIVIIFFISVIFFYHLINSMKKKTSISLSYNKNNFKIFEKFIFIIFYILTAIFFIHFIILSNSPLLAWYNGIDAGIARYEIYKSPKIIQLLYVIYCRLLSVIIILIAPKKKILFLFLIIELIALQSLERQSTLIIMAATFGRFIFQRSLINSIISFLSIYVVMTTVYIQGNYIFNSMNIYQTLSDYFLLVSNRVVLDPSQMLHRVYVTTEGLNFYLLNNRIINIISFNLFSEQSELVRGYTAIGNIIDGYKIFSNHFGVIIAGLWFAILLNICSSLIRSVVYEKTKVIVKVILFLSIISFYYSNIFSLTPIIIISSLLIMTKIFRI